MNSACSAALRATLIAAALVTTCLCFSPVGADAAVPGTMSYQGRLGGAPALPDSFSMTFKIFAEATGGTALWTEDHGQVYVDAAGLFEVALGGLSASSFPSDGSTPYLEITVNSEVLTPRKPLNSVPYAFVSATGAGPRIASVVAGQGLTGGGASDSVTVNAGAGLGIAVSDDEISLDTGFTDGRYVGQGEPNSVTASMIVTPILSGIDSLQSDGGNIDLVAGANVNIDHPTPTSIRISASTSGTSIAGVLAGNFILVPDSAGVSPRIFLDSLRTDARYVNEGQASSVTTGMIVPALVSSVDGIQNDGGDVDLIAGSNITIDHPSSTTIRIASTITGGQVDSLLAGDLIMVTTPAGPAVTVSVDTSAADARYVVRGEASAVTAGMIEPDVVGSAELRDVVSLDSLDTRAARARNIEIAGTPGVDGIVFPDGSLQTTAPRGPLGAGSAGQVTFWSGPAALVGDNALVWDNGTQQLSIGNSGALQFMNGDGVGVGTIRADNRAPGAVDLVYDSRRSHLFTTQGPSVSTNVIECQGNMKVIGDLSVVGTLSKGAGSFRIDHPLDPANKYLSHSFVESPDMMDIYNGNAVLDDAGRARIELPEWFEALNQEFRYQLTAIGSPGPNLYIASEVADNRFEIAGGTAGMKVSWQVTGIRHDPYAVAHRIPVEEEKSAGDRGRYLHPELYDQASAPRMR